MRPDLRGTGFEREVLGHAENRTVERMRRHGVDGDRIHSEAYRCDTTRVELLTELGWVADGIEYVTVVDAGTNEASRALYRARGLTPWQFLDGYAKPARH